MADRILGAIIVNDLTSENEAARKAVVEALASLQNRGCDINPYSVASESGVARDLLTRDPALMQLLAEARNAGNSTGTAMSGGPNKSAESRVKELEAYNSTLRQRIQQLQAELIKIKQELRMTSPTGTIPSDNESLRAENEALRQQIQLYKQNELTYCNQIDQLTDEIESATRSVNIAWQQGYLAGQHAASSDPHQQKNFIETLAEAASAATGYGEQTFQEEPLTEAHVAAAPAPVDYGMDNAENTSGAYIADHLAIPDDPEVLNDPFTAKLLNALQGDIPDEGADDEANITWQSEIQPQLNDQLVQPEEYNSFPPLETSDIADMRINAQPFHHVVADPSQNDTAHLNDAQQHAYSERLNHDRAYDPTIGEHQANPEHLDDGSDTSRFSAEELHTLFRDKYVNPEDGPDPRDAQRSGTFPTPKKFVGTNKSTNNDPLPNAPRVFPPEIRKACRLLGVNPEELTRSLVTEAWKKEMAKPGVHPDTGGDTEMAIYLNTAKDTLMRWIDAQTPKLGKKFGGSQTREQPRPHTQPRQGQQD